MCLPTALKDTELTTSERRSNSRRRRCPSWACHLAIFILETCCAISLASMWHAGLCSSVWDEDFVVDEKYARADLELSLAQASPRGENWTSWAARLQRRLVANDFTADFSRRLAFHRWIEQDVILDRPGFERYLQAALASAGLDRTARQQRPSRHQPQNSAALQKDLQSAGFRFNPAYTALEHRMLPGAPWSQGRDQFMMLVRHGLRPNHYFFSAGCGPFSMSGHVVRYLLASRYFCIESDEYLLRAAVEYEVPEAGLIHKRPNFFLHQEPDVGALSKRLAGAATPPSHFDFAVMNQQLADDQLEASITGIARYLRPRSGRLVLRSPLPIHLQRRLGLQQIDSSVGPVLDSSSACPLSVSCDLYVYHT